MRVDRKLPLDFLDQSAQIGRVVLSRIEPRSGTDGVRRIPKIRATPVAVNRGPRMGVEEPPLVRESAKVS